MYVRLNDLRKDKKKRGHASVICYLQRTGKIGKYVDGENYVVYDTDEYDEYKRNVKRGPRKTLAGVKRIDEIVREETKRK